MSKNQKAKIRRRQFSVFEVRKGMDSDQEYMKWHRRQPARIGPRR